MSFIVFIQIFANVVFTVALFVVFARLRRPAKDDPRLSKGLQLLSSKIAVLEDLSDRTETQVHQMLLLLDQKSRELQSKIALADQQVSAVRQSMEQSLEVAQIFQDKIPHSEIIERQNSVKYIRAARLAHAGASVAEIASAVDLPLGEIDFISKVNQESLSFREEDLPAWAKDPMHVAAAFENGIGTNPMEAVAPGYSAPIQYEERLPQERRQEGLVERLNKLQFEMKNLDLELAHRSTRNVMPDMTQAFSKTELGSTSLERLGEEFRRAVEAADVSQSKADVAVTEQTTEDSDAFANKDVDRSITSLNISAVGAVADAEPIARKVSISELEAARAAAAALRTHSATSTAPTNIEKRSIRKVEFPRI